MLKVGDRVRVVSQCALESCPVCPPIGTVSVVHSVDLDTLSVRVLVAGSIVSLLPERLELIPDIRVYVSARWSNRFTARVVMEYFESNRFEVTHDWTTFNEDVPELFTKSDTEAVARADALIILVDSLADGAGLWVELGVALALGKKVLVYDPTGEANYYDWFRHPGITGIYSTLAAVVEALRD